MVERIYAIGIMLFGLTVFGSALRRTLKQKSAQTRGRGGLIVPALLAMGCLIASVILWLIAAE
jgi:hypothetical protein